jgi:hypothetical protein
VLLRIAHHHSVIVGSSVIVGGRQQRVDLCGHGIQQRVDRLITGWGQAVKLQAALTIVRPNTVWQPAMKMRRKRERSGAWSEIRSPRCVSQITGLTGGIALKTQACPGRGALRTEHAGGRVQST